MKPKITVFAMGGTIASAGRASAGVKPSLTAEMIVDAVPGIRDVAEVAAATFRNVPSPEVTLDDLLALRRAIVERIETGDRGVVVTHGTDTIEETAFVLDRIVGGDAPVVVTGAMRNPTMAGPDGPANLLNAARVAVATNARGLGTLLVMNDEIHAARYVQKARTANVAAFASSPFGPLGWIAEDTPRIAQLSVDRRLIAAPPEGSDAPVAIVTFGLGDDGRLIEGALDAGYAGIVVQGTGGGHVPGPIADLMVAANDRVPVVLASRVRHGELLHKTYDFAGSEVDLARRGVLSAGWLDAFKARLLLSLLLRTGADRDAIARAFEDWLVP